MDNLRINQRIFVVGSPRSGTSLLQSLIGGHPLIHPFPETHLFYSLFRNRLNALLKISSNQSIKDFNNFIKIINQVEYYGIYNRWGLFTHNIFLKKAIEILDSETLRNGKVVWTEKTPLHLHCINQLEANNKDLKFIHILRDGKDVVKSSYGLSKKYPNSSWGKHPNIDYWIKRWVLDIKMSHNCLDKPNHYFLTYKKPLKQAKIQGILSIQVKSLT